jgi:hypothetical protein
MMMMMICCCIFRESCSRSCKSLWCQFASQLIGLVLQLFSQRERETHTHTHTEWEESWSSDHWVTVQICSWCRNSGEILRWAEGCGALDSIDDDMLLELMNEWHKIYISEGIGIWSFEGTVVVVITLVSSTASVNGAWPLIILQVQC